MAPENGWLEDEFPFGKAFLQGRTVSFREGTFLLGWLLFRCFCCSFEGGRKTLPTKNAGNQRTMTGSMCFQLFGAGRMLEASCFFVDQKSPIHWGHSPLPVTVITRTITYLVGDSYKPERMPLLLGGGHTQPIHV